MPSIPVRLGRVQLGGPLVILGGDASSAGAAVTSYVDPDAGTLIIADDAGLDEVDPDAGSLIVV